MDATDYIDLTTASHLLPGRPSITTVWRWAARGRTCNGKRVQLRAGHGAGGKLWTTREWVAEFVKELEVQLPGDRQIGPAASSDLCGVPTLALTGCRPGRRSDAARQVRLAAAERALHQRVGQSNRNGNAGDAGSCHD